MARCVPCTINKIRRAIRTGVVKWKNVKPDIRKLCVENGYDPEKDANLATMRAARTRRKRT